MNKECLEDKLEVFRHNYNPLHLYCRVKEINPKVDLQKELNLYDSLYKRILFKLEIEKYINKQVYTYIK